MTDQIESLVLEHLHPIRRTVDRMERRLNDLTTRVGHLETNLAPVHVRLAEQSVRSDRLEACMTRREKQLDLAEQ